MARRQLKTSNVAGGEYTGVGERVLTFREDNPNSKILTQYTEKDNGEVTFKTYIWKDKNAFVELIKSGQPLETALLTADSEASSRGPSKAKKEFEKQETISLGRALAYLGYSGNGQIASTEEMEDFYNYKEDKLEQSISEAVEYIGEATDIDDLKKRYMELPEDVRKSETVFKEKETLKQKFEAKNLDKAVKKEKKSA
jgi:hypothetical protein